MPGTMPIANVTCRNDRPYRTPAAPAMAAPMTNVSTIARLASMPIKAAVPLSSETARIAVPTFERITNRYRPPIMQNAATTTRTSTQRMLSSGMGAV